MESDPDELRPRAGTLFDDYIALARAEQKKAGKMTSERQKAANRANARHSTGPKTSEGIAAVRLNAVQHGLLTRDVVLPKEDAGAFEDLFNQVRANLSPVGPIEEFLADRVVNAMWRLRRLERAETALFHRFETNRRLATYSLAALHGQAIDAEAKEADALANLARYERSLERSFHRALDELRRIQDKRQNRPSPPILDAITLNTDGTE
jgi:hypothetical protein